LRINLRKDTQKAAYAAWADEKLFNERMTCRCFRWLTLARYAAALDGFKRQIQVFISLYEPPPAMRSGLSFIHTFP
jgi:hypothetical protein